MEWMQQNAAKTDRRTTIAIAAMFAVGLLILLWPGASGAVLCYLAAAGTVLVGIVRTVLYFQLHERVGPFSFGGLALGLSLIVVGTFFLIEPDVLRAALPVLLGCFLIFAGFGSLQTAIELRKLQAARWYLPLAFALAALLLGTLALANPFSAADALMVFLGVSLCIEAALQTASLVLFRSVQQTRHQFHM